MTKLPGLGATGEYPQGKLNETDEGGITIAVGIENGKVVIQFGKPVAWIGFGRAEAMALASSLVDKAMELKG